MSISDLPLWEVFIQAKPGKPHQHVGSVHAADPESALLNARDVYTRRGEGTSIWAVRASEIVASQPENAESIFDPADDKVYRHPTFYKVPKEVSKNM